MTMHRRFVGVVSALVVLTSLVARAPGAGAVQFTTGILGSETIIAINRDPQAPIFNMADLGLVGDANTLLPLLIEALRKRV